MGAPGNITAPPQTLLALANSWSRKQTITPAANENALAVTGFSLTGANAMSLLDLAGTWNTSGAPTALKINIADTASNAASLFFDCQLSGVSKFNVTKTGIILVSPGSVAAPGYAFIGNSGVGFSNTGGAIKWSSGTVDGGIFGSAYLGLPAGNSFRWSSTTASDGTPDLSIFRDAAGIFAQRNGTAAQASRIFNTFTDASNNEWFGLDWQSTANVARLRLVANGTGTLRPIAIDAFQKAGAAVAGDIPTGTFALVRDTSGLTTKLIYNNAGTLMTVGLT